MWGNKKDDPLDKMRKKSDLKCDYCSYRPRSLTDYMAHLKEKHPQGGDPKPW